MSATLVFPENRIASFVCSFGAAQVQHYEVVGTEGSISLNPAYEYAAELEYVLKVGDKETKHKTPKRDQFAPELSHFAECIIEDKNPRPSGEEGLNDLLVIEAIRKSTASDKMEPVGSSSSQSSKPDKSLVEEKPGVKKPPLVNVKSGSKD